LQIKQLHFQISTLFSDKNLKFTLPQ